MWKRIFLLSFIIISKIHADNQSFTLLEVGNEQELQEQYTSYLSQYSSSPFHSHYTYASFRSNILAIIDHNNQNHTYKQGLNQFTGLDIDQHFNLQRRNYDILEQADLKYNQYDKVSNDTPAQWDWRLQSVKSKILDQGNTTDSYNYAAKSTLEQHYTRKYYENKEFSLQQIRDCVDDLQGPTSVFSYVAQNGGLAFQDSYPESSENQPCYYNFSIPSVQNLDDEYWGYLNIQIAREDVLQTALYELGPVTISFIALNDFYKYSSGIFQSSLCSGGNPNQTMVIVGYGVENGVKYWIVQNSWGASWGEQGYARILRGVNMCGISFFPSVPKNISDPAKDRNRKFRLQLHNGNTARCLDGSGSGVYFSQGYGDGLNKVAVAFEGEGEMCLGNSQDEVIQCAQQRVLTKSVLGSSSNWSYGEDYDYLFKGDPNDDNFFSNWNRFVIRDCSGAAHQGYQWPWVYRNQSYIFFNGHNNTRYGLNLIARKIPLGFVTNFVLMGSKVGGLAALAWTNYFQEYVLYANSQIKYYTIVDSAFYIEQANSNYTSQLKNLYSVAFQDETYANTDCAYAFRGQSYLCLYGMNSVPYIKSPLFIIQSAYDTYQIANILKLQCATDSNQQPTFFNCSQNDITQLHQLRDQTILALQQAIRKKPNVAIWAPSCSFSGYYEKGTSEIAQMIRIPMDSGFTVTAALQMFMMGIKDKLNWQWIDEVYWPLNTPCAFQNMLNQY